MIKMIRYALRTIFSPYSSFGRRCEAIFGIFIMFGIAGSLVGMILVAVDLVGITSTKTAVTIVEAKQVVPTRSMAYLGKIILLDSHLSYQIYFKIEREDLSLAVEKNIFDRIKVGDRIEVDYESGRLSNLHQPTYIRID